MRKSLVFLVAFLLLSIIITPLVALGATESHPYVEGQYIYNQSGTVYNLSDFSSINTLISNSQLSKSYQIAFVLTPTKGIPTEEIEVFRDFFTEEGEEVDGIAFVMSGDNLAYLLPFGSGADFLTREVADQVYDTLDVNSSGSDNVIEVIQTAFMSLENVYKYGLGDEYQTYLDDTGQEVEKPIFKLSTSVSSSGFIQEAVKGNPPKEHAGLTDDRVAKGYWKDIPIVDSAYKVHDLGAMLTDAQEAELEAKARQLSQEYGTDFMLLFTNYTAGRSEQDFLWDFYEANAYGVGNKTDGVMFLLNLAGRRFEVSVHGRDIQTFSNNDINNILDQIGYSLGRNDTDAFGAATVFLQESVKVLDAKSSRLATGVGIGAIVSALLGGVVLAGFRFTHKRTLSGGVNPQHYVDEGQTSITHKSDKFARTYTTRTRRNTDSGGGGGGGGSSMGRSSSGSSFRGGGRSF